MSGAREATTEQYFSRERSIARRALVSSTPTPEIVKTKWSAVKRRGCSSRRVPRSATSRRSEEHTSELQSRLHLVCRLLLEKKKNSPHPHQQLRHLRLQHLHNPRQSCERHQPRPPTRPHRLQPRRRPPYRTPMQRPPPLTLL